tara:strand:+ start:848 stop:1066 length:219 start_codon:yes stop_codon:yes gene_type:complete
MENTPTVQAVVLQMWRSSMKVGDLVKWENADGAFELGIVTHTYGDESINVVVYFPQDGYPSTITRRDLEVIA